MRLINIHTLELREFGGGVDALRLSEVPAYAILSHRWGDEEVSFQDFQNPSNRHRAGFKKIIDFCSLLRGDFNQSASEYGFRGGTVQWAWIDTCCIDKTSSAELSESINSMWEYYRCAAFCVAYLSDVQSQSKRARTLNDLRESEWFERGWTLQELLAPFDVRFFTEDWKPLGSSRYSADLCFMVSEITRIPPTYLNKSIKIQTASVAQRMSWAAGRRTTRGEDLAYCLMGLFDVNMPLLYGEGQKKALFRLQEQIVRQYDDESIFAWRADHTLPTGVLAERLSLFKDCGNVRKASLALRSSFSIANKGLEFEAPAVVIEGPMGTSPLHVVKLNCTQFLTGSNGSQSISTECIIVLHEANGVFFREPSREEALRRTTYNEVKQKLANGEWKKAKSRKFNIALSGERWYEQSYEDAVPNSNTDLAKDDWFNGFHPDVVAQSPVKSMDLELESVAMLLKRPTEIRQSPSNMVGSESPPSPVPPSSPFDDRSEVNTNRLELQSVLAASWSSTPMDETS